MKNNVFKSGILALMVLITVALVASPAAADPVLTRTLSDSTLVPGETVHVTLELTGYLGEEALNVIQENYSAAEMAGWTVSNEVIPAEFDAGLSKVDGLYDFGRDLMSGALPQGDYTVEYDLTVDAGTAAGVYDLTGSYIDSSNRNGYPAVGDTQLTVEIPLPVADFNSDVVSGPEPLTVQFTDNSVNADTWEWDFDNDGLVDSTEQNPEHTFTTQGIYTVSLTVSNEFGEGSVTKTDLITVTNVPTVIYDDEVSLYYADMNDMDALNATGLSYTVDGMLNTIDGISATPWTTPESSYAWAILVNGETVDAFGTNSLVDGDVLQFIYTSYNPDYSPNMFDQEYIVTITVNKANAVEVFDDSVSLYYADMNDMNALNATGLSYTVDGMLDTIDGISATPWTTPESSYAWAILINGYSDYGNVSGFGTNNLTEGDVLEFIYTSYNEDYSPNLLDQRYTVTITVNNKPAVELFNDEVFFVDGMNDMDALNATGLSYTVDGMLNTIDGISATPWTTPESSYAWAILINGYSDYGNVSGFGTNNLTEGDVLEFIYTSYNEDYSPNLLDQRYTVTINVVEKPSTSHSSGGSGGGTGSASIVSSVKKPVSSVEENEPDVIGKEVIVDNTNDGDSAKPDSDNSESQDKTEYQEPEQQESEPDTPGFEIAFAVLGLLMAVYLAKRH